MLFNDFNHEYGLRKSNIKCIKTQNIRSSLALSDMGIYLKDDLFEIDEGVLVFHPSKGTPWVSYINQNCSDSYGGPPPEELSKFIVKRNDNCFYSEYRIQDVTNKKDSFCAAYCFFILHLT